MPSRKIDSGLTGRVRGRPFTKGNKNGKVPGEIVDSKGYPSTIKGGVLESKEEPEKIKIPEIVLVGSTTCIKPIENEEKEDSKDLKLIESLVFKEGENTLTIRFSERHNRMYRVQVFLNDSIEIRPVTYTGRSPGYGFWNLLKGMMKK